MFIGDFATKSSLPLILLNITKAVIISNTIVKQYASNNVKDDILFSARYSFMSQL